MCVSLCCPMGTVAVRDRKILHPPANSTHSSSKYFHLVLSDLANPTQGLCFHQTVCNLCPDRIHYFLPQISFFFLYILSWQFLTSNSQFNRLPTQVPLGLEENGTQSLQSVSLWNTFRNIRTLDCLFNILYNFTYNLYKCLIIYL